VTTPETPDPERISKSEYKQERTIKSDPPPGPGGSAVSKATGVSGGKSGSNDPLINADKWRARWGTAAFIAAGLFSLTAIGWTGYVGLRLDDLLKGATALTTGIGLVLLGKSLVTIVLAVSAYSSLRAGERLLMPLAEYHRHVEARAGKLQAPSGSAIGAELERYLGTANNLREMFKPPGA
jgi:hypothetical protein